MLAEKNLNILYLFTCALIGTPLVWLILFILFPRMDSKLMMNLVFGFYIICLGLFVFFAFTSMVAGPLRGERRFWAQYFSGYWMALFPLTPMELMDTKNRRIPAGLSSGDAFTLCLRSLRDNPSTEILESDEAEGRILVRMDLVAVVRILIRGNAAGGSDIILDGCIADWPILEYGDDIRLREQGMRQVIRVLDHHQTYLGKQVSLCESGSLHVDQLNRKDIRVATLFSVLSPGLGQLYCGKMERGVAILALTAVGIIFYLLPGLLVWIYGIFDSLRLAGQVNDGSLPYVRIPAPMMAMQFLGGTGVVIFSLLAFLMLVFGSGGFRMINAFFGW